ncbi:MAG TPA: GDP-mannose 4,6-dehydratase [Vicinamibacterales bacterium]|nr:GDP-mannose 4,6-dehydratase [Vicinamibacterales bacterium]
MTPKALVLGVTGQDGSYLAEVLLDKGYEVHGMVRRSATGNTRNIQHLIDDPAIFNQRLFLCRGDLADPTSLYRIIRDLKPQEIYNEADQDHVGWSYDMVGFSADITGAAVGRLLEIIRQIDPSIRYFQPCTSNMFGRTDTETQNEETPFRPQSPYACAKVLAYHMTRYYREAFGMFASTAILYNHESPRRTVEYVTRKITRGVARIARGRQQQLVLGDLSARIDWGYAREFMDAAWRILHAPAPDDFVIATGEAHSVREWADEAFAIVGLDPEKYIVFDPRFMRPSATSPLVGDISKARRVLGYEPKIKFKELVRLMVEADLREDDAAAER